MQLILVFTSDSETDKVSISGVADNQDSADFIAASSLSKKRSLTAYTDRYNISSNITDDLYIVYAIKYDITDDIIAFNGNSPSSLDLKIYKTESGAIKKSETFVKDIGGNLNKYKAIYIHAKLNELIVNDYL